MESSGQYKYVLGPSGWLQAHICANILKTDSLVYSAATNNQTGEGVAIKKVTNVFSKKILAKRALREIKLLQHFRGHRNVCLCLPGTMSTVRPH